MQTLANGMMTRRFCMTSKSPLDGNRKYESCERCRVPPSLRFVQGRVRCCQIAEILRPAQAWARGFQEHKNMIPAPSHPPLQTTQGWGTLVFFVVISRKTEMVGHPPIFVFYSPSHVIRAL